MPTANARGPVCRGKKTWCLAMSFFRSALLVEPNTNSHQANRQPSLPTRKLPVDVIGAVHQRSQHFLRSSSRVRCRIARIFIPNTFYESETLRLAAVQRRKFVVVPDIESFHCQLFGSSDGSKTKFASRGNSTANEAISTPSEIRPILFISEAV